MKWNLEELFKNEEELFKEIDNIKVSLSKIKEYESIVLDSKSLLALLDTKWLIKERVNNVLVYCSLKYYKNVNDLECANLKNTAEELNSETEYTLHFIDEKILKLGKDKITMYMSENSKLNVYSFYLENLFRLESHVKSTDVTGKIKNNVNKINKELNKYNNLLKETKYGKINYGNEEIEITSSNYGKLISSKDREIRKLTYIIANKEFDVNSEVFANILNTIYGYRIENAKLENYDSVLEKVLYEENIDKRIINVLISLVNKNLPEMQKYLSLKAKKLEVTSPHLYDFNVPFVTDLGINYTLEDAKEIILNALKPLGIEYLNVVKYLFEGHIDAIPDENKHQSITFSWNTYSFLNYRGTYRDLKNLIHETGHIVNYYLSKNKVPFIYEDSSVFIGETASLVNEILLNKYLFENAKTNEEKIFYLSKEIENYFTTVFKQTMYTELESTLYALKEKEPLTKDILNKEYLDIIKKYYGNQIDYTDASITEWTRLGHLYRWSYYPYKYATGLLISSLIVDLITTNKLSTDKYIEFLSSGSSNYSLELLKILNIDLTNSLILQNGFNVVTNDIDTLIKLSTRNQNIDMI